MINPILNFQDQGKGEPLIIIHGLFGSSRNWQTLSQQFAQNWRVISVDLRNHGNSFHDDEMNYPVMTEDVEILMDHLHLTSAHILGHSMGGKVAMTLCHLHPQKVEKLIVADIAPVTYSHSHKSLIEPILEMDLSLIRSRKQADEHLAPSITDKGVRLFLLQNLAFLDGRARWKLNWPVLDASMPDLIGFFDISNWTVDHDSLFIRGALSDYVSSAHWSLIQQHFTQAQLSTIQSAGHWLHAEQPEQFYQRVSEFLTE